ncbi:MAG: bifunctional alpha,alpha-trehalose-phosphate synthase (UDP-forming)/trehalose-phosphatase [Planctomycetota bacterium]|jgi:trehalose 6-phosphate synthase/phosphatase
MPRLLIVSNRLSVSVTKQPGGIRLGESVGGLATGLASLSDSYELHWIGWPGLVAEKLTEYENDEIAAELAERNCRPVFLTRKQVDNYYEGFSNKTIWPLFHYFSLYAVYEDRYWQAYKQVNEIFADSVVNSAKPDDYIWVHDYQLMLVPQLVRDRLPLARVGFFLHIPFPSFELFRLLPWRTEILNGLLGADLIGFHTYDYARHFLDGAARLAGAEHSMGTLTVGDRVVKIDAFPMGIDYEKYAAAVGERKVQQNLGVIRRKVGDRKIIISIDRLDYTKGIIQRLEAFDLFLSHNPQYRGRVTLILLAVPSRTGIGDYMELRRHLEGLVGRINGEHGTIGWVPVWYLYRTVPFERLIALYSLADVALVTPLRDGMNLIAKEFVATKTEGTGVLILSEMAGAASELGEAVIVNAHNKAAIIEAIKEALEMPEQEQIDRNRLMQSRLSRYDLKRWAHDFLETLSKVKEVQQQLSVRKLAESHRSRLLDKYAQSQKRLLLLDYDGTLVGFAGRPDKAGPDDRLLELLSSLADDGRNELVIISGRDKDTLTRWLGGLDMSLIAEHGGWIRKKGADWKMSQPLRYDWKQTVRPILELYADRTPGSAVEEKDFSLVWHFRRADAELAYRRIHELRPAVLDLTANLGVGVFEGSKIIEVRNADINKGRAVGLWLAEEKWPFVLAAGDDYTDEDLFAALPENAYSIKVGHGISRARFNVDSVQDVRLLLVQLIQHKTVRR